MIVNKIDTRQGTDSQRTFSHGNCLPYTGVPFGMNYFAPETDTERGNWWFHPHDRYFYGFRLTHQPSPWMGDFSHFTMLPLNGTTGGDPRDYTKSSYRPEESVFNPAYLKIKSQRYQITTTLIPSMYGALLELTGASENPGLALTLPGRFALRQIDDYTVSGRIINFTGCEDPDFTFHFIFQFETPIRAIEGPEHGTDGVAVIRFGEKRRQVIHLATSFLSAEQACLNLEREQTLTATEFLDKAEQTWERHLTRITIDHHDKGQRKTFYHNLYRLFLFPQTFYEWDATGEKRHYDTTARTIKPGPLYTNNGFWDTYRTTFPLFSLIAVDEMSDMLEGFLNSYRESGFLPKWLSPDERGIMPGTLIDGVIADACVKDIRPDLMPEFLTAMQHTANVQSKDQKYGRHGMADYRAYGYLPNDYPESVNHSLDYAYSDFCLTQVAHKLNDPAATRYQERALNYRHLFDPNTQFMRGKDRAGHFRDNFDPYRWGRDYAEGSAWQSSFAVPHDFAGLIQLYGGNAAFEAKLVHLCNQMPRYNTDGYGYKIHEMSEMAAQEFGQLAISNQPSFHYPYLFTYIGKPEMGQPLIKQLLTECFDASPSGYPGDEDNGSMAAWYLFSALGFYPVTPGSGEYVIGMPLIDDAAVKLSNGNTLTIHCAPNQPQQQFIDHITVNGRSYERLYFTHQALSVGGEIAFHLGIVPHHKDWAADAYPYSLSNHS